MKNHSREKIAAKIVALETMPICELKRIWKYYFSQDPLWVQREYMLRRIVYQMQVEAYGGLSKSVLRRLQILADKADDVSLNPTLSVGMELVREHKGKCIRVRVLAKGFEYNDRRYTSLSAIASEVMGCRISGPKFFGLREGRGAA